MSQAPGTPTPVLAAENLDKKYDGTLALRGLSFSLQAGRVLGFLGPNGAGKTTAIRILTTILEPTSGDFTVDGIHSRYPQEIRRKIGVLPESLGFPKQMSGLEFLTYFGQHYGRSAREARKNGLALLEEAGLKHRGKSLIGTYSRGMRQRLGIARALVNDPVVVFLDEPTLGLDPRGKKELLELVRRIATDRHAGVVLCSHLLTEVEEVCDEVVILKEGQNVAAGTVRDILERGQRNVIHIRVPELQRSAARRLLADVRGIASISAVNGKVDVIEARISDRFGKNSSEEVQLKTRLLNALLQAEIPVLNFDADGSRLQDIFFQLTEGTRK